MKDKKAGGPDNIPPSFLKSISPSTLQELLSIFNSSFPLAHCPQILRVATIIHYSKLENTLVKSPHSVPSVSCHVLPNFWNVFLLTVSTISPKPTICSVDSKSVFVKDRAARIRFFKWFWKLKMAFKDARWNAPYWHFLISAKHTIRFREKNYCFTC